MRIIKTIKLPLFFKFAIISTIVVIIFGSINIYFLWNSVYKSFEKEIDKRCKVLAKIVAEKSLNLMVYEDNLSLYNVLDEITQSDPSIAYIFILNRNNEIVAQTFNLSIPDKLININKLKSNNYNIEVIRTNNFKHPVIRDIAYPILRGEIGTVRLGIVEEHIQQEMREASRNLIIMISAFLIFGLVGTVFFSYLITSPIKKISDKAQKIDLNSIDTEDCEIDKKQIFTFFSIKIYDELDILITKFSEMILRLKLNYVKLKETQSALIQAEKMASLGTLSAGVAHEINNPISGIKNCVNRIQKKPENIEQNLKYIELIKEATEKIESVVQHLLSFSRKQEFEAKKVLLNAVIESVITLTKHRLTNKKVKIISNLDNEFWVNGSFNHLEQIFVNFILNSFDAIVERQEKEPDLEGIIEIKVAKNKQEINVHILDNGIGIPQNSQTKIFDPFFTSKEVGKGTGLGLSLSFNLIKKHKGDVTFSSTENQGTEFIIQLPCYLEN